MLGCVLLEVSGRVEGQFACLKVALEDAGCPGLVCQSVFGKMRFCFQDLAAKLALVTSAGFCFVFEILQMLFQFASGNGLLAFSFD